MACPSMSTCIKAQCHYFGNAMGSTISTYGLVNAAGKPAGHPAAGVVRDQIAAAAAVHLVLHQNTICQTCQLA